MKSALMVVAPEMFRDEEYADPKAVLESRGAEVTTASTHTGTITGRFGLEATADVTVGAAAEQPWDAVVFVGGAGSSVYFDDPVAHRIASDAQTRGSVVSAICIAPSTLAHAGLLDGKRVTSFPSQRDDLVAHGATWTGEPVEVDGLLITGNGPEAATQFGEAVADALGLAKG